MALRPCTASQAQAQALYLFVLVTHSNSKEDQWLNCAPRVSELCSAGFQQSALGWQPLVSLPSTTAYGSGAVFLPSGHLQQGAPGLGIVHKLGLALPGHWEKTDSWRGARSCLCPREGTKGSGQQWGRAAPRSERSMSGGAELGHQLKALQPYEPFLLLTDCRYTVRSLGST